MSELQKEKNRLTSRVCSSQSFASIFSCVRLSELPTSNTTLGRSESDAVGWILVSASFILRTSSKVRKEDKPRLKLCVLSNVLIAPTFAHPGGLGGCGAAVNSTRATVRRVVNSRWASSWTLLGIYLTMKL